MEKFTSKNFKILMIAVVVLLGVLVYGLNAGTSVFSNVFGTVSAPLLTAGTNTTKGAKEFLNLDGMSKEELKALYNDLSEENRKLREQLVDYYTLKDENASYENILSVKKAMPDLQLAAGSVVGRDPNDVFGDFTINCGSLAGVSVGDAVITETGVVGVVEEVYAASSRVRSILSEKTQIGATDKSCKESGVVTSDIQFANSGKVKMLYLTRDTEVQPGSIITTSGAGGVFPGDTLISVDLAADKLLPFGAEDTAGRIRLAVKRFQISWYRRNWSLESCSFTCTGVSVMSVGRIASCASCAPSRALYTRGVSGQYRSPYLPRINSAAAVCASAETRRESVRM